MSFDSLKLDIWHRILDYLVPGVPKALSGVTKQEYHGPHGQQSRLLPDETDPGATSREDIRAPELARLMRTSQTFNQLAAQKLYRTVVTDDLPGLHLGFFQPPANPRIDSKAQLLEHCRELHLEYKRKGDGPRYMAIMAHSFEWQSVGFLTREATAVSEATFETAEILGGLKDFAPLNGGITTMFRNLAIYTVGQVFGGQDEVWQTAAFSKILLSASLTDLSHAVPFSQHLPACQMMVAFVFRASPIRYCCQRGPCGPLSWPAIYNTGYESHQQPSSDGLFTVHLGCGPIKIFPHPIPIAPRTRWVIESDRRLTETNHSLVETLQRVLDYLDTDGERGGGNKPFDIEIYGITALPDPRGDNSGQALLSPAAERAELKIAKDSVRGQRLTEGKSGESKHVMLWEAAVDTPPCKACGWTVEG